LPEADRGAGFDSDEGMANKPSENNKIEAKPKTKRFIIAAILSNTST
jgi:hypothetical protein